LKTLEEPPEFVHLILLSSEPAALLETISSRCQAIEFAPLPAAAIEAALLDADLGGAEEIAAAARLSAGDLELARLLLGEGGRDLREQAVAMDWSAMLKSAAAAGEEAEAATREALEEEKEAGLKRSAREIADAAKRAGRRRRTELLDLGLQLASAWFRDLAATAVGAADLAYNRDRLAQLRSRAEGLDPAAPRRAAELVQDTRRRLDLNVSEELALEALSLRLARVLT
jgi:DNA polymerase-3 subunit delta'